MKRRLPKSAFPINHTVWWMLALLLSACGALPTNPPDAMPDTRTVSPVTTVADAQNSPPPTAPPVGEPVRLVVLHTNDNWGETEPCG